MNLREFCEHFISFDWLESYFFETDGIGLLLTLISFSAAALFVADLILKKNGGGKDE